MKTNEFTVKLTGTEELIEGLHIASKVVEFWMRYKRLEGAEIHSLNDDERVLLKALINIGYCTF